MFGRKTIPIPTEEQERFDKLRSSPLKLLRDSPLMPEFDPRGFRHTLKAMANIKTLPKGTEIELDEIRMKGHRAWYRIRKKKSLVVGWINSIVLEGEGIPSGVN